MSNEQSPSPDQIEIQKVSESSQLSSAQLQAALLDACGISAQTIADRLDKATSWIYALRNTNSEYRRTVKEFYQIIARRVVENTADANALFNREISASAATLIEIRDSIFAKDSDRIKASLAFLDRAPAAPKATMNNDNRSVVIQIPISEMRNMRGVLGETGNSEDRKLLELLEQMEGGNDDGGIIEIEREKSNDAMIIRRVE